LAFGPDAYLYIARATLAAGRLYLCAFDGRIYRLQ